jgi:hypothetical protein
VLEPIVETKEKFCLKIYAESDNRRLTAVIQRIEPRGVIVLQLVSEKVNNTFLLKNLKTNAMQ